MRSSVPTNAIPDARSVRKQRRRDESGFSLVEMMVVLVILTIGLLPLALVQTSAQQDVMESGTFSGALHVAEMQMEAAKTMGFGVAATDSGIVDVYNWRTTVDQPSFGLSQITVNVQWIERGDTRSVQIMNMASFR